MADGKSRPGGWRREDWCSFGLHPVTVPPIKEQQNHLYYSHFLVTPLLILEYYKIKLEQTHLGHKNQSQIVRVVLMKMEISTRSTDFIWRSWRIQQLLKSNSECLNSNGLNNSHWKIDPYTKE